MAAKYRLNLEIKYLHKKKQTLNNQLYQIHLKCAWEWQQLWHLIQPHIDQKMNNNMKVIYGRLNKKLEALKTTQTPETYQHIIKHTFQERTLNLTQIEFSRDELSLLNLGWNYAIERPIAENVRQIIIETE